MDFASPFLGVFAWWRRTRCKFLLVLTLLCLVLRENYPFSHFPMYSSFSKKTYYLYLTDVDGNEIPTKPFAISNSTLRKIFDSRKRIARKRFADSARAEAEAGRALLKYLEDLPVAKPEMKKRLAGAQVQRVDVHQEGSQLILQKHAVTTAP